MTRIISGNYRVFEEVRDRVLRNTDAFLRHVEIVPETLTAEGRALVDDLLRFGIILREEHGHEICEAQGRRYLSGGWLEELAWLAAIDAGADEAVFGQAVGWSVHGYSGENEIDLIMREGERLGFVSCKALRSEIDMHDKKHRNRLMDAVHEADNLIDHFGRQGDKVAILVSTDLFDEAKGTVRYNALMGKAAILDVRIIPLEEMAFDKLRQALANLIQTEKMDNT
ncbi:MAG: DUF1887 family protein [Rhizobiales bacterium]|nr:DUF1887 family protein [Hyphomicrobiales bacterium]